MLAPCILSLYLSTPDVTAFFISEVVTVVAASLMIFAPKQVPDRLQVRDVFLLTVVAWCLVCLFGALPFVLSHTVPDITDAVFESVSAVTTTGATVISGLDFLAKDILLWRSMMQWLGGLGIVALGAAILPFLRIGGMRLFRAESSDFSEKTLPHTRRYLIRLLIIYMLISVACTAAYAISGMTLFDAINHAMTTVSTGGFSTHDASLAFFDSPAIEAVAMLFMLIAAVPFVMFLPLFSGKLGALRPDGQVRSMLVSYATIVALLVCWLAWNGEASIGNGLRHSAFSVISIGTTTGYISTDYTSWGSFSVVVFFFLTFVGGCSGSTSGGIKIFRFKIAYILFRETVQRLMHPNSVLARSTEGYRVTDDIVASVVAFALAFACTVGVVAILLAGAGNDFVTSFSAASTAVANVGPGIGGVVGPVSNFASLNDASKWIISGAMLLGRLEIFTVLIVLTPAFWRG